MSAPGVSALGGVVSQHALRQISPVNRMTDRCKNITLATTSIAAGKNIRSALPHAGNPGSASGSVSKTQEYTKTIAHLFMGYLHTFNYWADKILIKK